MDLTFENLSENKKVFLASDFHLGSPNHKISRERERRIVGWIESIRPHCAGLILAGDIFDFWFEYKKVVPKGFVRLLGKLSELSDSGVPIIFFTGNHDLWMKNYLEEELGALIYHHPESFRIGLLSIHIGHGDGLGPGDHMFKFNKSIFKNSLAQWCFRWLHPDIGMALAHGWSEKSRLDGIEKPDPFLGEKEWILQYCRSVEGKSHHDFYLFGHRHLILEMQVGEHAVYLNPGDWIETGHYVEITRQTANIQTFEGD